MESVVTYSFYKSRERQAMPLSWILLGVGILLTIGGSGIVTKLTRGIRNNNPGNIERTSVKWKGMAADQPDSRFIKFIAPEWGVRAIARILRGDILEGTDTISALIHEWAPSHENLTAAYIAAVSKAVFPVAKTSDQITVASNTKLDVAKHLKPLITAIIKQENGVQPYSDAILQKGIDLERSA